MNFWDMFYKNKLALTGCGIVILLFVVSLLAPVIAPYDPGAIDLKNVLAPPSSGHWFGTDQLGRDVLSRMIWGARISLKVGFVATGLAILIGMILGAVAGYYGGWIDAVIRTVCQILTPIPVLLIQVVVAGSLDKRDVTIFTMAIIVAMLAWMGPTLVVRAQVMTMKERQFVSVAKLSGVSDMGIIFKEILPNLLPFIAASFVGQVFGAVRGGVVIAVIETRIAKLRLFRVPELLGLSFVLALLAVTSSFLIK